MNRQMYRDIVNAKKGIYSAALSKQQKYELKQKSMNFMIKDGELHFLRKKNGETLEVKVVKSAEEADLIFKDFHASAIGAHMGVNKTLDAISRRFYWPGMSNDIKQCIAACIPCQKKRTIKQQKEYIPVQVSEPFQLVGMDLVGKLNKTSENHVYICVMIDYKTKWAEAYPLKSKRAEEVAQCIVEFFYRFGAPQRILTDRGGEFQNKLNMALCKMLGIERSFCAPYHPQTNGLVERMNGTLTRTLTKLSDEKPSNWHLYLNAVMFGLRTKIQMTTKYSPFYLMFGREARYPTEVPETFEVPDNMEELVAEEVLSEGLKRQHEIFKVVTENEQKAIERQKRRRGQVGEEFQVGDLVFLENVKSKRIKGDKLASDRLGPYTIEWIKGKSADLKLGNQIIRQVSTDNLSKCTQAASMVPSKLQMSPSHAEVVPIPLCEDEETSPCASSSTESVPPSPCFSATSPPHIKKEPESPCSQESMVSSGPLDLSRSGDLISEIWQGRKREVVWTRIGAYRLFTHDIKSTAPEQDFTDAVLNAYIALKMKETKKKAFLIDCFAMTAIWLGQSKGMRKLDPENYDILIGAVLENHHWRLVAMYPQERRAIYLDPFGATPQAIERCKDVTRAFIRKRVNVSRWACATLPHPKQNDSHSCGAFVCKFAECILADKEMDFPADWEMHTIRREIACTLLDYKDELTDLCHACGHASSNCNENDLDEWIECTREDCSRWYHLECVGRPEVEGDYICWACN